MGLSFCYDVGNRGGEAERSCMQNWNDHAGSRLRKLYPGAKNDVNYAENCALSAWVLFCDRYL